MPVGGGRSAAFRVPKYPAQNRQLGGLEILSSKATDATRGFPRVVLGDFTFRLNPRERIGISSSSSLATHEPPGTGPRYEYMGRGETTLQWAGQFRDYPIEGVTAWDQFEQVRLMEKSMQVVQYGRVRARVWVESLNLDLRRSDRLDYTLSLKVDHASKAARTPIHAPVTDPSSNPGIAPSPAGTPPPTRTETVREGDTFESISNRLFLTPNYANVLRGLNPHEAESSLDLTPGDDIQVPLDVAGAEAHEAYQAAQNTPPTDEP